MAAVAEISAPFAGFMRTPQPGPGVCRICFNLTDGYERCYACQHGGRLLDVVAPISYSIGGEQLHHALRTYKRPVQPWAERFTVQLAAVLWRYLAAHEGCVASAAGVTSFPLVTTVPSRDPGRDDAHPLHRIVGELVAPTRPRFSRLLKAPETIADPHVFDAGRFTATRALHGEPVLLIDDTWTTGASAQSAATALKRAGAGAVAAVVIGRHINREWHDNDRRLQALPAPFDWSRCVCCQA